MIRLEVANQVLALLNLSRSGHGLAQPPSQRAIARMCGVSRGTVSKIAAGIWQRRYRMMAAKESLPPLARDRSVGRCTRCGRRVELPCLACEIEGLPRPTPHASRPTVAAPLVQLGFDFRDEATRLRYEKIHAEKLAAKRAAEPPRPAAIPPQISTLDLEPVFRFTNSLWACASLV
ncbi:MAG: hypothetical protein ABSG68_08725 [Thermoguttaceae bacterium]